MITGIFWVLWIASFLAPAPAPWHGALQIIGAVVLVIHIVECVIFRQRLQGGGNGVKHTIMTLLFGFFYIRTLPKGD
ncbi:MAG: DUF1145 domain-containing protein [Alphaproteobacteria bacterium]